MVREKVRRPREEVQKFVTELDLWGTQHMEIDWTIGGSWRREAETIGDLDVMIVTADGMLTGIELPSIFQVEDEGPQIKRGNLVLDNDSIHIDFWACTPAARGAFLCFITGPKALNIQQRARAQTFGYTLSQYGVFDRDGKQLDNGTEVGVYSILGMPWLRPVDRQDFAEKPPKPEQKRHSVSVPSDSDPTKTYTVSVIGDFWTCTCLAFKYSREIPGSCKHIKSIKAELKAQLKERGVDFDAVARSKNDRNKDH